MGIFDFFSKEKDESELKEYDSNLVYYEAKEGENLVDVCVRFSVSLDEILSFNEMETISLTEGQKIFMHRERLSYFEETDVEVTLKTEDGPVTETVCEISGKEIPALIHGGKGYVKVSDLVKVIGGKAFLEKSTNRIIIDTEGD
jgi:hypothetical protein